MRVTAEVKASTEKAIRAAARRLFVRKGFDATSTRQIATAAKVAVGTVFNYFPSKEALAVSIAAEAFEAGRVLAAERTGDDRPRSLEEDLFTLVACDIRALEPIRSFIAPVLEAGLSPVSAGAISPEAAAIRTERLEAAIAVLGRHALESLATPAVMHLYWSLYLGVLSYWAADPSPRQEDTWSLLDQGVRMFTSGLRRTPRRADEPTAEAATSPSSIGVGPSDAAEVDP